jgi:hypothetical protein
MWGSVSKIRKKRKRLHLFYIKRKKSTSPPTYGGWNTSPSTYENGFLPPELFKTRQITPEAVLKNS